MTSTASLASKNQKLLALYTLIDIPGIRILTSLKDLTSLTNLSGLNDLHSLISSTNFLKLIVPSILVTKWPILVSQCGLDHQKSSILLIFGTLSVGGCGGQGCYFYPNNMPLFEQNFCQKQIRKLSLYQKFNKSSIWHWFPCNLVKKKRKKSAKIWVWIQISNYHQFWCNLLNAYFAN